MGLIYQTSVETNADSGVEIRVHERYLDNSSFYVVAGNNRQFE